MTETEKLEPPKGSPIADPGAHDLAESSDSEDQFTDAQSAPTSPIMSTSIPTTRVERIDDEPAYGEVPGTEAYAKREQDAIPDEIAVIHDDALSQTSTSTIDAKVPTTLVEEAPGDVPGSHSAKFEDRRMADASPDLVLDSEGRIKEINGESTSESSIFLTPRSASLWSQLVAPPPLAPPDWIRSRIRRLFLVSLGVPVDLDEILPASKQKKLVLPSLHVSSTSPRTSSDSRSVSRLRQGEGNTSSTSVDTQGKPSASKKRKGPPPQPELDLVAARHLCMTTDEALNGMTNAELKTHVAKLEAMEWVAKEALEYWKKRTDEKLGDREAFEGVIENLVKHARKVRK
ncbi:uncharacterized protein AUP68_13018 [Ilyonectria robusta]